MRTVCATRGSTRGQLAFAVSSHWYGRVLTREVCRVLRKVLGFDGDGGVGCQKHIEDVGGQGNREYLAEWGRYVLPMRMDCLYQSDSHWIEVNPTTLNCLVFYQL